MSTDDAVPTDEAVGTDAPDAPAPGAPAAAPAGRRDRIRRAATIGAALLLLFALVVPNQLARISPWSFLRIPVEGLIVGALVLTLPPRLRRPVAIVFGVFLGLLTVVKFVDMGFYETLDRPFDPVLDWILLGDAVDFVRRSYGGARAGGAGGGPPGPGVRRGGRLWPRAPRPAPPPPRPPRRPAPP